MSNQNGFDEVSRACVPLHVCLVCVRALSSGVSAGESVFCVNDFSLTDSESTWQVEQYLMQYEQRRGTYTFNGHVGRAS
jgi:hypothetical protein